MTYGYGRTKDPLEQAFDDVEMALRLIDTVRVELEYSEGVTLQSCRGTTTRGSLYAAWLRIKDRVR